MGFGTPYLIGSNTPGAAATQTITVSTGTTAGDCIIVGLGNTSAAGATVSSVTDSKSNTYTRIGTANTTQEFGDWFIASGTTALTTSDTITVNWSSTSGTKNCLAIGASGVLAASPVDQNPAWFHSGLTTNPTVTSGTLAQAVELAIGIVNNANGGGAPSAFGSFTQVAQLHTSTNSFTTLCSMVTASTAAVTFSCTTLNAAASITLVTLLPAASVAGTVQPRATIPVPRRQLARAVWQRQLGRGVPGVPAPVQQPPVVARRRIPARAVWRQNTGPAFTAVAAPRQQPSPAPRRVPARAYVRFTPVTTANPPPVAGSVQPRATVPVPRRTLQRAVWQQISRGPFPPPSGTVQPRAALPSPARGPQRGVTSHVAGLAFVAVPAPRQQPSPAPRRRLARAYVQFTPVKTVNSMPVNGTIQPRPTIAVPRRAAARAVAAGTVVRTVNAPPVITTPVGASPPGEYERNRIIRKRRRLFGMGL